jgi:hypothetical protein
MQTVQEQNTTKFLQAADKDILVNMIKQKKTVEDIIRTVLMKHLESNELKLPLILNVCTLHISMAK